MKKLSILFFILALSSCTKDPVTIDQIKPGCVPSSILISGDPEGASLLTYKYENNRIIEERFNTYQYEVNLVSRINNGPNQYEIFKYEDDKVIASKQFSRSSEQDDFEMVIHFEYLYDKDKIIQAENVISGDITTYYRDDETMNIDSLVKKDSEGTLLKTEYLTFDNKRNVYSNICSPQYNFHNWIFHSSRNNIVSYEKFNPTASPQTIGYIVEIEYNGFDFPAKTITTFSTGHPTRTREFEYLFCQ